MSELITFDDLLDEEPETKTSIRVQRKVIKAGRPYRPPEWRDTPANWDSPKPELVVLFLTETTCTHCGVTHKHPTYENNAVQVRYRVSRFRTLMRPYRKGEELRYRHLPKATEVIKRTTTYCHECFDEHAIALHLFDFVGPPEPTPYPEWDPKEAIRPFAVIDPEDDETWQEDDETRGTAKYEPSGW